MRNGLLYTHVTDSQANFEFESAAAAGAAVNPL